MRAIIRLRLLAGCLVVLAGVVALAAGTPTRAQAPAFSEPITGIRNFTHIVASLDRAIVFYRDVIGLQPDGEPRLFSGAAAMKVVNISTPGAQSRFTSFPVPGSIGVELVEYQGVDRTPAARRVQDPGAAIMTFTVRSLDPILARAREAAVRISTSGGAPVTAPDGTRIIVLQDPDGFFVALVQPSVLPETSAPASNNIVASNISVVAADAERTARLYEQALGFQVRPATAWNTAPLLMDIAGTAGAQHRFSLARVPGTFVTISFDEFSGIDRRPLRSRFQDPGTAVLQLLARDVKAAADAWKKAGGEVVTTGGEPVTMGALTLVVLRDPNNVMLEIISAP
jgi:lactoylglutathione lyase